MSLRDELQAIYDQQGEMTPEVVVTEATPKTHPLHGHFEWNDKVAGHQYRLVQARELIRSVKIVYREGTETEDPQKVRAWQAVRTPNGHAYRPTHEVLEDEMLTAMVLRDMEREWKQLHRRYGHFAEFAAMVRGDLEEKAS